MPQGREHVTERPGHRHCKIFNCDRRRGNFCCEDCDFKSSGSCRNPCLNGPERFGQAIPAKQKKT